MRTVFPILIFSFIFWLWLGSCKHEPAQIIGDYCHPDTVYFENDVLPLLLSSCAKSGCHDAATASDGVILDNYNNIIQTGDVQPFNPNGSDLYEVLTEDDPDKIMPRPPLPPLSTDQIQLIRKWILQGAKNNACEER